MTLFIFMPLPRSYFYVKNTAYALALWPSSNTFLFALEGGGVDLHGTSRPCLLRCFSLHSACFIILRVAMISPVFRTLTRQRTLHFARRRHLGRASESHCCTRTPAATNLQASAAMPNRYRRNGQIGTNGLFWLARPKK